MVLLIVLGRLVRTSDIQLALEDVISLEFGFFISRFCTSEIFS